MSIENWAPLKYRKVDWKEAEYFDGSYDDIVSSFGYEILHHASHGDYKGDDFYCLKDGEATGYIGFLNVGWGSCSGCDALQSDNSRAGVEELRSSIHSDIKWQESPRRMADFLLSRDWPGQYFGFSTDLAEFIQRSLDATIGAEWRETLLTSDARLMLANPEVELGALADAVEESDLPDTARQLRGARANEVLACARKILDIKEG